jgi:hypothetical protein
MNFFCLFSEKKRAIISSVREKICGDPSDKLICCPTGGSADIQAAPGE